MENSLSKLSADCIASDGFHLQETDAHHVSNQTAESRCGCMRQCGREPSAGPATSQQRHYKSLAFLCISFHLIFASFLSLQALQSSFNEDLGFISLAVLYSFFMVSCLFAPFVIRVVGPKYVISVCYFCHCIYIASNYYPSYYTLLPGSMVLGCASAPLWAAASVYLVSLAQKVAQIRHKEAAKSISIFVGVFFLCFFLAAPVGNAVASAVLLPVTGGLLALEGSGGNASNASVCMALNSSQEERDWPFYFLMSIYLLFDVSALVMSLFGLESLSENTNSRRTCRNIVKQFKASLSCVGKMLFNWRFLLLAPICWYSGIHIAIFAGLFAKHFVTECLGVGVVGLVLMVWGLSAGASSGALGKLATKVPPIFIMMAGIVGDAAVILFLIYWERVPSYIAVFAVAIAFGLEDGVWNTIPTSLIGIIAKQDQKETGYSLQRFWQCIGFTITFALSSSASLYVNLWFFLAALIFSVPVYMITDVANTSDTKDFFKKVLRVVCCYSGVYSTRGTDVGGQVTAKGLAVVNSLTVETTSDYDSATDPPHRSAAADECECTAPALL